MQPKLTARWVASAPIGRHHLGVTNLYLLVAPTGSRRYIYRYSRPNGGGVTEMTLGAFPAILPDEAKAKAKEMAALVTLGTDPVTSVRAAKIQKERDTTTLAQVIDDYAASSDSPATRDMVRDVRRHGGALLTMSVAAIGTPEIKKVLGPLRMRYPTQARRILAFLARFLDYARVHGLRDDDHMNPATWRGHFSLMWPSAKAIERHHPAMDYHQVPRFMGKLLAAPTVVRWALAFTILMGARTGETLGARYDEIRDGVWTLPAGRTKQRRSHSRPLPEAVLEVIELARSLGSLSPYLFPSGRGGPLSRQCMERALHVGMKEGGSIHGFRAALRSYLGSETNVDFTTCEEVLGHAIGDATVLAYARGASLAKMRMALNLWAAYCMGETTTDNIIPFVTTGR
jgi:integrase